MAAKNQSTGIENTLTWAGYDLVVASARSILPLLEAHGIATAEEVGLYARRTVARRLGSRRTGDATAARRRLGTHPVGVGRSGAPPAAPTSSAESQAAARRHSDSAGFTV